MDPLGFIKSEIEKAKEEIRRQVQIDLLREMSKLTLSRLATLDADNTPAYLAAIKAMP